MGWLPALALVLAVESGAATAGAQLAPQLDPVALLLQAFEDALESGDIPRFATNFAPALSASDRASLDQLAEAGVTEATVRERSRLGGTILVEIFVAHDSRGRVSSWRVQVGPRPLGDGLEFLSLAELSAFDDLIKLALDETRQYVVRDLTFQSTDFIVTMPSGTAFLSEAASGATAIVLRGRADIRFTPPDATEQGQLRIFDGRPALIVRADELFLRIHPRERDRWISAGSLQPTLLERKAGAAARAVFASQASRSYHFSLGDLSADRWSMQPAPGSVLVDFRTIRHGWLTYSHTPEDAEDISVFDRTRRRQISIYASAPQIARRGTRGPGDERHAFEVRHSALDLRFEPERRWLSGRASLRIALDQPASALTFRLAETLAIGEVSSPELGPMLALRVVGQNSFVVGLPEHVSAGRVFTLDVHYHGRLEPQTADREALDVDEAMSGQEPLPPSDFPFQLEPRFLYSSRVAWYPQTASNRHATAQIRLTVPFDYGVVASGEPGATAIGDVPAARPGVPSVPVRTAEFRADRPVRYLAFLVTKLVSRGGTRVDVPQVASTAASGSATDRAPAVEVRLVTTPQSGGRRGVTVERTASMVRFFAGLVGEAPYPSLTVAAVEDTLPGGHSPPYFAIVSQPHVATPFSWRGDPVAFQDAPDYILAHEVAHQWWGQAVGWRNYHEQWISEGFAQYFAWMYIESTEGTEVAHRVMARMRASAVGLSDEGPIYLGYRLGHLRGNSRVFRTVVYNKSAVVLHMLRRLMGDEAFFLGVRRFYRAARFQKAGIDDVRDAFQAHSPFPLDRFFTRWILETGVPALHFSWTAAGAERVLVRAEQRGPVFDLPYEATVHYVDGTREQVLLRLTESVGEFAVATRGPVRRVTFDDTLAIARKVQ